VAALLGAACGQRSAPTAETRVIVTVAGAADLSTAAAAPPAARRLLVAGAVRAAAASSLPAAVAWLEAHGGRDVVQLPIVNAVAVTLAQSVLPLLTAQPWVVSVVPDGALVAPSSPSGGLAFPGWNLLMIRAPDLWALGHRGENVVVAALDTGVDAGHPDLGPRWRGGRGGWFDPWLATTAPYDAIGHGTQVMGILAGGGPTGASVGVAPGATWIAGKIYDDRGTTTVSVVHQAFAWLLDPDGDPSTADAPDVVSISFGDGIAGACDPTFQPDLAALRAAGILVVAAAGNGGPAAASSVSPANLPGVLSAGAVDATRAVASFSSRGPSPCAGAGVFPSLVAPGVGVTTTDVSLPGAPQYTTVSGTSFAAPHVAGAAALLWSTLPAPTAERVEAALRASAVDVGAPGPDPDSGLGLLDVYGAFLATHPAGGTP
jgi:subtilisin family serine protease